MPHLPAIDADSPITAAGQVLASGHCCALGDDVRLYLGDCMEILPTISGVDAVISDPPFSGRTHEGHDCGAQEGRDGAARKALGYAAWTDEEVRKVCGVLTYSLCMDDSLATDELPDCPKCRRKLANAPDETPRGTSHE